MYLFIIVIIQLNEENLKSTYGIPVEGYVGNVKIQFIIIVYIGILNIYIGYISFSKQC